MASSKTWDAMKSAWLSSSLRGKTGEDDFEFSPDESLKFSKEKLPENKTKDDNKVILKGIMNKCHSFVLHKVMNYKQRMNACILY